MSKRKPIYTHNAWLDAAREDLATAKALLKIERLNLIPFLCQQAAEKALKAFLIARKLPIERTHDLLRLLERCLPVDINFNKIFAEADYLNPFSTRFRYPSEYDLPDIAELKDAIKQTQKIVTFIVKRVSTTSEPGQSTLFDINSRDT